jgi:hypothetical protein
MRRCVQSVQRVGYIGFTIATATYVIGGGLLLRRLKQIATAYKSPGPADEA